MKPSKYSGNTQSHNKIVAVMLAGTIVENWAAPANSPTYIFHVLSIAQGSNVTFPAGAVIKIHVNYTFLIDGQLNLAGTAKNPIYVTNWFDDSVGGDTNEDDGEHKPSESIAAGITITAGGSLTAESASIRYCAGISASSAASLKVTNSEFLRTYGIQASRRADPSDSKSTIDISNNKLLQIGRIQIDSDMSLAGATPVSVRNNMVSGVDDFQSPYVFHDVLMYPSRYSNNSIEKSKFNTIEVAGTIVETFVMPVNGPKYLFGSVTVIKGATLICPGGNLRQI